MARRRRRRSTSKIFGMKPMSLALLAGAGFVGFKLYEGAQVKPAIAAAPAADNAATAIARAAGSLASMFRTA